MNYQGEQVNFSQVSNSQLLSALQATNRQVAVNGDNLVQMGIDMTEMGEKQKKLGVDTTDLGDGIKRIDNAIKGILQSLGTTNNAVQRNSQNLVQIGIDHENMGKGGGDGITQYIPLMAAGGIVAYLLKGKLKL
tara:strand:+ start:392 stop:793 length:402 start_codon:yes stop_codon:yes gene_type:complete